MLRWEIYLQPTGSTASLGILQTRQTHLTGLISQHLNQSLQKNQPPYISLESGYGSGVGRGVNNVLLFLLFGSKQGLIRFAPKLIR